MFRLIVVLMVVASFVVPTPVSAQIEVDTTVPMDAEPSYDVNTILNADGTIDYEMVDAATGKKKAKKKCVKAPKRVAVSLPFPAAFIDQIGHAPGCSAGHVAWDMSACAAGADIVVETVE